MYVKGRCNRVGTKSRGYRKWGISSKQKYGKKVKQELHKIELWENEHIESIEKW